MKWDNFESVDVTKVFADVNVWDNDTQLATLLGHICLRNYLSYTQSPATAHKLWIRAAISCTKISMVIK